MNLKEKVNAALDKLPKTALGGNPKNLKATAAKITGFSFGRKSTKDGNYPKLVLPEMGK